MDSGSGAAGGRTLTERQRHWLKHLRAAERKGEPLSEYAARHDLSVSSLYEAKRRLRQAGLLEAAPAGKAPEPKTSPFARVVLGKPTIATSPSALRVRLDSGAVLEWSEAPRGDALRELLGMLS